MKQSVSKEELKKELSRSEREYRLKVFKENYGEEALKELEELTKPQIIFYYTKLPEEMYKICGAIYRNAKINIPKELRYLERADIIQEGVTLFDELQKKCMPYPYIITSVRRRMLRFVDMKFRTVRKTDKLTVHMSDLKDEDGNEIELLDPQTEECSYEKIHNEKLINGIKEFLGDDFARVAMGEITITDLAKKLGVARTTLSSRYQKKIKECKNKFEKFVI